MDQSGIVSLSDAASELGLHPGTLRQQIANGKLHAFKVGRDWLVTRDELNRYRSTSLGRPGRRSWYEEQG